MTDRADHNGRRCARMQYLLAALIVAVVCAGAAAGDDDKVYIQADAVISGKTMYTFAADDEAVNVVEGDFSLTVGRRKLSGVNAVLWIDERRIGETTFRDIEVYIEGDSDNKARIIEADGATTTDRAIMVTIGQQGKFLAKVGRHVSQSRESTPLYRRALAMRKPSSAESGVKPSPSDQEKPTNDTASTKPSGPTGKPALKPYSPITFRADDFSSEEIPDPSDPEKKLRITIAKGNVYLSQGSADSDLFIQMRADSAVLYTAPQAGDGAAPERIVGAYLEGDVILRRGERTIQGPRLFYDFSNSRAIFLEPVMRTVQEQRGIPVYIRAKEGRQLGALPERDDRPGVKGGTWYFRKAIVTTSDFLTPGYHIAARRVYLEDTRRYYYDEKEKKWVVVGERAWHSKLKNATFNLLSVPVLWTPLIVGDAEEGHTALRKISGGSDGRFGWGVETDWYLFRLLGIPRPEGFKGTMDLNWYERGFLIGPRLSYERQNNSGYVRGSYLTDRKGEDDFGTDREDIAAPKNRGRFLWRHKQFLPRDWMLQAELSYLSDRNFLEEFHRGEYWTDKEQETILYAKKQRDNWAFTALGKWRINDFLTQTEAYPDLGAYLIGQSLWQDRLTLHKEAHLGIIRLRPDHNIATPASDPTVRGDARIEVNVPFAIGPVRFLPSVANRITAWSDTPNDGSLVRTWGKVGLDAQTQIWRIYNNVENRLWDLHRIKHVITPYGSVFFSGSDVQPDHLYAFSPEMEQYIRRLGGGTLGVRQLWQTQRGPEGDRHIDDWLRLNIAMSLFDDNFTHLPADGRYYFSRPEYSLARNAVNSDAAWYISDSTILLGDVNYDIDSGEIGRANVGVTVLRDPRLKYYVGARYINALDSSVGTLGVSYQIDRKYNISAFEQYDFDFDGGDNLSTSVTLTRKFPRLYVSLSFGYDATYNDVTVMVSIWPEGVPEARFGGAKVGLLQRTNEKD